MLESTSASTSQIYGCFNLKLSGEFILRLIKEETASSNTKLARTVRKAGIASFKLTPLVVLDVDTCTIASLKKEVARQRGLIRPRLVGPKLR